MEDIPDTLTEALAGVRAAGRPALEAGAGAGNAIPDPLATALRDHVAHLRAAIGERSDTGRMYSVRLDLPE